MGWITATRGITGPIPARRAWGWLGARLDELAQLLQAVGPAAAVQCQPRLGRELALQQRDLRGVCDVAEGQRDDCLVVRQLICDTWSAECGMIGRGLVAAGGP